MSELPADSFGTADLRRRVLDAWTASPARFREDANAEEDLALGAYRDRVLIELAQNAADAAVTAGVAGRLLLRLDGTSLVAANTGAPLDAAGVEALSTLRASTKRDGAQVGRFGVGFAAVRAVADDVTVVSEREGVRWSAGDTRRLAAGVPALATALAARDGVVPALRLPFPATGTVPDGYDTAVTLSLRDAPARAALAAELHALDDVVLLALPALSEIVVEVDGDRRVLRADDRRWRVHRVSGDVPLELYADRPVEERTRTTWFLAWALPVDAAGLPTPRPLPGVVCAPTPTSERLDLPAVLLGSFPLDSTRRLVAPGPLRDFLAAEAGWAYAALVAEVAASGDPSVLGLVPGPAGAGELDARIRGVALAALRETAFVPVAGSSSRIAPRAAVLVPDASEGVLAAVSASSPIAAAPWARWGGGRVLLRLGARSVDLGDLVDELPDRSPGEWRATYAALAAEEVPAAAMSGLPVPLVDGRTVRGPRTVLIPSSVPESAASALAGLLGLRLVHPDAAHPLLARLGARESTPVSLLNDPLTLSAVFTSANADDPDLLSDAVLTLVAAALAEGRAEDLPPMGDLALPDENGELVPAGELVLPGSPLADLVDDEVIHQISAVMVDRWGAAVLGAVEVLTSFRVLREADVVIGETGHDLDGEDEWYAMLQDEAGDGPPPALAELVAVRDLDAVRPDAWPAALRLLAAPPLREAVLEPALLLESGTRRPVPSYAAWWLRNYAEIDGRPPTAYRDPGGDPLLAGLYDDAPELGLDAGFRRAIGVRTDLAQLLAEPGAADDLLDRLADSGREVPATALAAIYAALVTEPTAVDPADVTPPPSVRLPRRSWGNAHGHGVGTYVAPAADVLLLDAPDLAPLVGDRPVLVARGGQRLADLLELRRAGAEISGRVESTGTTRQVPAAVVAVLPGGPASWVEHDDLVVDGTSVEWRYAGGTVHAATLDGLARGLSWAAGAWSRRLLVAAVLAEPDRLAELLDETAFG